MGFRVLEGGGEGLSGDCGWLPFRVDCLGHWVLVVILLGFGVAWGFGVVGFGVLGLMV